MARYISCLALVYRQRVKKLLEECIVSRMQNDARPDAPRLEPHPGP